MKLKTDAKKSFDLAIKALANSKKIKDFHDPLTSIVLRQFIIRTLKQFHLEQVDFYDVVSIVCIRGTERINSGEHIKNPGAWIRVTSYNIIREMSRQQLKEQANSEFIERQIAPNDREDNNEVELEILEKSLQILTEKDRQILELKYFQDKSWKQVVADLADRGEILKESTVRQRGKRALERLKKAFWSLKSEKLSA
ncbi:MAG: sigma-70 family RNA polymerase sigma factor [Okeania sp. SIO2D1]|nr:sigma-70 family RNA polymerase sigma factor [Okeania sp. SIO2D1]